MLPSASSRWFCSRRRSVCLASDDPGRSQEILQADAQRLTDVFRRDGGEALKNFIDARVNMQIAGIESCF